MGIFSRRIREVEVSKLASLGQPEEALKLAERLTASYVFRVRRSTSYHQISHEQLGKVKLVAASGYFYSGSGAVVDYLLGIKAARKWAPSGEVCILKYPGGFGDQYRRLVEQGGLQTRDLLDLWLHIAGLFPKERLRGSALMKQTNRQGAKIYLHPNTRVYRAAIFECFLELVRNNQQLTPASYVSTVQDSLDRAFRASAAHIGAGLLILDQVVTAWRFEISRLLRPMPFIVVHRDPRDQFVDANCGHKKMGRKQWTASKFSQIARERREAGDRFIPMAQSDFGHRIIQLAFEDFVTQFKSESRRVILFAGLEGFEFDGRKQKFDPRVSRKNVGKYRRYASAADLAVIEHELRDYLYPGYKLESK